MSVGYTDYITATPVGINDFNTVIHVRDGFGNTALMANTDAGQLFLLKRGETTWGPVTGAPSSVVITGKRMTAALVSGITYIYFENVGCYFYEFVSETFIPVTLAGLDPTTLIGLVGSFGYLVAYSKDSLAWSSTIDATDFVPSLATGAGGGQVEGAKGQIVSVISVNAAFIVFTDSNAVAAQYSQNIRYPFTFSEITGAGGLYDPTYVSYDSNAGNAYAYTTSGLQSLNVRSANVVFPEVTDYLSGSVFEDFDEGTLTFSKILTTGAVQKRVVVVADRYLVISYGLSGADFTHALVYDLALKQWARLKVDHVTCFEMLLYTQDTVETPKKSIAFLETDGGIRIADTDISSESRSGVIILGKYQHHRARMMTMQQVEVEGVADTSTCTCHLIPALDGKTLDAAVEGYLYYTAALLRIYNFHKVATNHSILIKGTFNLSSLILNYTLHGAR
jgi:hypothetical protein